MLIYVAGPYSAPTKEDEAGNVQDAINAGAAIIDRGHWPIIPHLSHWFHIFTGSRFDYETYLQWDFALIRRCDALLFLGSSPGADRERSLAEELGMPIFEAIADIPSEPVPMSIGAPHVAR